MNIDGSPTKIAMIVRLVIVIVASLLSALSVGRWQECQMAVQYLHGPIGFHAGVFLVFISTQFSLSALFVGMWDYIVNLPMMILTVWSADGAGAEMFGNALAYWQGGWTIFYWA